MRAIYKYPLLVADQQTVPMQRGATILCVQNQNDIPCIWAIVDPEAKQEPRRIVMRGTGHEFTGGEDIYIGTFQLDRFVFHVFEAKQ